MPDPKPNQPVVIPDQKDPNAFRVERLDEDGACELALFYGPGAEERAWYFAHTFYIVEGGPSNA